MSLERPLVRSYCTRPPRTNVARLWLALSLAILTTSSTGTAAAQDSSTEKSETIRGTVINRVTRQPISRALVSSSDQRLGALTDSEGRFEFVLSRSSAGENGLDRSFNAASFLTARKPGFLPENTLRETANTSSKELTIALAPEALIVGKVTLPNSEATDSIFLELYRRQVQDGRARWVLVGGTQSRADGEFRFAELRVGTYKVLTRELLDRDPLSFAPQGQLYGYPPVYAQNAPDFSSASPIQVSAGMTASVSLSVSRQAYHQVHIPVINAVEAGGVNVSVYTGDREPGFSLGYDAQSRAIEGMLPDGSYTIEASGSTSAQSTGVGVLTIVVHGAAVRGPAMTLVPDASVRVDVNEEFTAADNSGAMTFNTGRRSIRVKGPRRYLNVMLEPAAEYGRGRMFTLREPTGRGEDALVIESVPPGRYWARVNSTRGYAASVRSGNVDLRHEPLVITTGGSPSPIEITMRDDTATIDGTVEGITAPAFPALDTVQGGGVSISVRSVPSAPAHVYCVPLPGSSGQYAEVWVSPDGTFSSPALAPGAYRVLAFDSPQLELEYRNPDAMQVYESKGPVVRVAGGQKEHVRLQVISSNE